MPPRRRAVRVRQEHARAGPRRPGPARDPGEWQGRLAVDARGRRARGPPAPAAAVVACVFQDPEQPARHGAGRRRRRVRAREPGMAARRDARPRAGGARRASGWRVRAAPVAPPLGRASSSGSRSPASSPPRPGCSCSTSRRRTSTPTGRGRCSSASPRVRERRSATIVLIEHRVEPAWPSPISSWRSDADGAARSTSARRRRCPRAVAGAVGGAAGIWLPGDAAGTAERGQRRRAPATRRRPGRDWSRRDVTFGYERGARSCASTSTSGGGAARARRRQRHGKSTLGRLLVGLLRPTPGDPARWRRSGRGSRPADLARRAGYVFQEPESAFLAEPSRDEVAARARRPRSAPRRRR